MYRLKRINEALENNADSENKYGIDSLLKQLKGHNSVKLDARTFRFIHPTYDKKAYVALKEFMGNKTYILEDDDAGDSYDWVAKGDIMRVDGHEFAKWRDIVRDRFKKVYETQEEDKKGITTTVMINDLGSYISVIAFRSSFADVILFVEK